MAVAHLLGLWALLQVQPVREAMRQVAPMMVDLITPDTPPPPQPAPDAPPPRLRPQAPILAAPMPQPVAPETFSAPTAPPKPVVMATEPAPPAPVMAPAPPAPPPPRQVLAASAVRYSALPPVEVPRAARRAGEHGVVWLRVVVGTQGQPLHVSVQRSSGYSRLDEQALWAMRQARFKPHTEDGQPVEVEVTAPIEYPEE